MYYLEKIKIICTHNTDIFIVRKNVILLRPLLTRRVKKHCAHSKRRNEQKNQKAIINKYSGNLNKTSD